MASNGVKTLNVPANATATHLLGNTALNTVKITPDDLATQMLANGPLKLAIDGQATQLAEAGAAQDAWTLSHLDALENVTVPAAVQRIYIPEVKVGAGWRSGFWMDRVGATEPSVPEQCKRHDAANQWFQMAGNIRRPEMMGVIGKICIEPDTRAVFNAMTTVRAEHLKAMNWMILQLKYCGVWNKFDFFMPFGGATEATGRINWRSPDNGDMTESSTMLFKPGVGYTAGGAGKLTTGDDYTFSDMTRFTQDSAHLGLYSCRMADEDDSPLAGSNDSVADAYIIPKRESTDHFRARLNSATSLDFDNKTSDGHFCVSRTSSTKVFGYKDGFLLDEKTDASTGVPDVAIDVGRVTSNDGSGTIGLLHAGEALDQYEVRAIAYIFRQYQERLEGLVNQGELVTAAMLDATVDLAANTAGLQAFFDQSVDDVKGIMAPTTYLKIDQIVIPEKPNVEGVPWYSWLRDDTSAGHNKASVKMGSATAMTQGGRINGLCVDYNYDRTGFASGGLGDNTDGTAVAFQCVENGDFRNIVGISAQKHNVDFLAASYNRSGEDGTYNQPLDLCCRNLYVDQIYGIGAGDDNVTGHRWINSRGGKLWGEFARATLSESNASAVEIDDFCDNLHFALVGGRFCHRVEIKGHADALPARNITIDHVFLEHMSLFQIRHIDHGAALEPEPLDNHNIHIKTLELHSPLHVSIGNGPGAETQVLTCYAYKGVRIDNILAYANGAADQVPTEVIQFLRKAHAPQFGFIHLEGFNQATTGIRMAATVTGMFRMPEINIVEGPTGWAVDVANGVKGMIGNVYAQRSGTAGTGVVQGYNDDVTVLSARKDGYGVSTSLSLV